MTQSNDKELVPNNATPVACDDSTTARAVRPRYRLRQETDRAVLEVELPGVPADAIDLQLERRVLGLRATPTPLEEPGTALQLEFEVAPFAMRWRLQADVDMDAIETSHANGVLTVTLPERAPERRSIPILEA